MAQVQGHVKGKVSYREGDGMLMEIPPGLCEVEVDTLDVTLSWEDDGVRCLTAMPRADFDQFVATGALTLD